MFDERLLILASLLALPSLAGAVIVPISDVSGLRTAIQNAQPGQELVLANGTYDVDSNLSATTPGHAGAPIVLRAAAPRQVLIRFSNPGSIAEGFKVSAAYWSFEGLDIEGVCTIDDDCEHAFHLFGNADNVVLRNNIVRNFNAQVKSNGSTVNAVFVFPDDVLIERNTFYDTRARNTGNPVTKLDIVGGRRWIVRANTIYDYQKGGGDTVSYAAFFKGHSYDGTFERNLVRCARNFSGGVRLGLSFGGGGTSPNSICEDGTCSPEHQNGIMRNNIIMNCNDVGIYLNKGNNSRLQHNTVYATSGIDVRYLESTADLRNNLIGGNINDRNSGTHTSAGDRTGITPATFASWFVNPANADFRLLDGSQLVNLGVTAPLVVDDFCGRARSDGLPDIGALEYAPSPACTTDVGGGTNDVIFANGFE